MKRGAFTRDSLPIVEAIQGIFTRFAPPLTVRQVYYQLATVGLVPLSQQGYRQAQRLLLRVREEGMVPWHHFADRTREVIRTSTWDGVEEYAEDVGRWYRRDYWRTQPHHVEVWLEKDAMSGAVAAVTRPYGVPLYVCRGFSSASFIYEAAAVLGEIDKPKWIYYLGDFDPSGLSIEAALRDRLREFGADFHFNRIAITLDDIVRFNLRPLEAKRTDSRYRAYAAQHGDRTIELDALPPDELRARIKYAIDSHIDGDEWERLRRVEAIERETIAGIASAMGNAP